MAQSPTERVTALERLIDTHSVRLDLITKEVNGVYDLNKEAAKEFAVLKQETALLKRDVEESKKWREERGRKLWMLIPPILAALVSSVLTGIVTYYLRR